jgi:UDP-N-acetylmuramoylalanine--D-glutamate ligase
VRKIDKNLGKEELALLSPAAASLDEFRSYADRGDQFKAAIKLL